MTVAIKTTSEALKYLYTLSLDTSEFRFRGQDRHEWSLQPSIYRPVNFLRYQALTHEKLLLERKPKTPKPPLTHTTLDLEWLMLCQHYGIPTRLLDWSADVLVALYFACGNEKNDDADGALFVCKQSEFTKYSAYDDHAIKTHEHTFVSTSLVNPRMRVQSGCFMLWGSSPLTSDSTESYDLLEYNESRDASLHLEKITIPRGSKAQMRKDLKKIYGISKDSLYLDSGFLETKYKKEFDKLKSDVRLHSLYFTNADQLTRNERQQANLMFGNRENMISDCINLKEFNLFSS